MSFKLTKTFDANVTTDTGMSLGRHQVTLDVILHDCTDYYHA
jgi:spermidine synthase